MLLKKHTWVMKEKEGVQAEKASVTQRNSRWVRGGRRERNVMGKKEQQTFFFTSCNWGRYQFRHKVNISENVISIQVIYSPLLKMCSSKW